MEVIARIPAQTLRALILQAWASRLIAASGRITLQPWSERDKCSILVRTPNITLQLPELTKDGTLLSLQVSLGQIEAIVNYGDDYLLDIARKGICIGKLDGDFYDVQLLKLTDEGILEIYV